MKKGFAFGIISLFIVSAVSPMSVGFDASEKEKNELLDNLVFYCYDEHGSSAKYEYYKEKLLNDYPDDNIETNVVVSNPVETTPTATGPMDSPWPMKCHDNRHTGRSPYSTENVTGLEKWRFRCDGVDGGPIIDEDGTIYFGDKDRDIYAIFPNGTMKWKYHTGGWIWSVPVLAEDGTLYVGSWDAKLYALNHDGTLKWRTSVGGNIASSPAIADDDTIYIGAMGPGDKGRITALNPDGTKKWHYDTGYWITGGPSVGDDGSIYIGSGDSYLYAMNPNGTLKWRYKTGHYVKGSPSMADDDTIYIGSWDDYLYALYPNNGTMKWKCKVGYGTETNPSIASDGTIYVGGDKLYAVYPNGKMRWTFDLGEGRHIHQSSPAISADGTIYVGTNIWEVSGGDIIAINPDGTEKWRKKIADKEWVDSSPCIAEDGTVYIGCTFYFGGYLHAFGPVETNSFPEKPTISGKSEWKIDEVYELKLSTIDPDNNPISFYIDWGDGKEGWKYERASGENCYYGHTWSEQDNYTIRAKAKDTLGEESDWAYLDVIVPKNKNIWQPWWLDRFPLLQRLLEWLLG